MSTASMATSDGLAGRSRISKRMLSAASFVESMGGVAGTASVVCSFNAAGGGGPASCWQNSASVGGSFGSVDPSATGALEMSV